MVQAAPRLLQNIQAIRTRLMNINATAATAAVKSSDVMSANALTAGGM